MLHQQSEKSIPTITYIKKQLFLINLYLKLLHTSTLEHLNSK